MIIRPAEKPSSWAQQEVGTAISQYLVPTEMQNRFTLPATHGAFAKLVTGLIYAKTGVLTEPYTGRKGLDLVTNPFSDTSETYVIAANKLGIISGVGDGKFDPAGSLTREQAATMISRAAKAFGVDVGNSKSVSFVDKSGISDWALEAVAYVSSKGIMNGTGNNNFSPKATYTYESCYISILRFYESMSGFKIDVSPVKPNSAEPKDMQASFTSAGCTYTIAGAGIDNDMAPGDLTENDNPVAVRFTVNEIPAAAQVGAMNGQSGSIIYSTLSSSNNRDKACELGF